DGGTTNYELVKLIPKDLKCTVISNNIPILHLLSDYQNIEVMGLGGRLYKNSLVLIGAETIRELESIRPDIYFMGVAHVDSEVGVTLPGLDECYTKQKMAEVSNEVAILVTEEKLETRSNFVVSSLKDINYIFTSKDV
ncbi:DeoR/GlpR transcriptional regulator, partial [Salmonella enterica]|nr:DeoR/GlpR transcriptional regulator [Salmonella enterica]